MSDPVDIKLDLEKECLANECAKKLTAYNDCLERIKSVDPEKEPHCYHQYFDIVHCVDVCVNPKLWPTLNCCATPMHYFFLEKQSKLTLRWKVRQVAFDAKYRYLYYSKPLSSTDIEDVMTRSQEAEGAAGHSGFASSTFSGGTSSRKVKWSGKMKVTQLRYAADEYIVPPTSEDFNEGILLTLIVVGYERSLDRRPRRGKGSVVNCSMSNSSEKSLSHRSTTSWFRSASFLSSLRADSEPDVEEEGAPASSVEQPLLTGADNDVPEPESPSGFIHMPSYPVNESLDEDFEDEDENMFRDIDLVPDDEEDEETSVAASDAETEASDEEEEEDEDDVALNSPPSSPTESAQSGYSFFSRRRRVVGGGRGSSARDEKTVQLQFRAANYDVFRIVSLRVRQALVRHGLCGPLHAGLPPYDPRNGIALATVPLHLRHAFRRLNDVVFYSLQVGHVVYVRQQREVRGMEGYLCITHDSILLLQLDGKCPRWLDLEDIVGVQYVLRGSHSFISIRAAKPYPDFVFIPIVPSYPPNSTFDSEECVEGIVSMVRRLLMQRLRAGEEVALAPVSSPSVSVHTAEDIEEYDVLCHIHNLSTQYTDVFKYIAQEQSTGAAPLRWRWDNSKTPTHFTFKRDLYQALEREEGEDTEDDDETSPSRSQRRPLLALSSHAQMGEAMLPSRQQQHLSTRRTSGSLFTTTSTSRWPERLAGTPSAVSSSSHGSTAQQTGTFLHRNSLDSNASFLPATMTQLMAPPSRGAELRAKQRLQVTRTDRRNASSGRAADTPFHAAAASSCSGTAATAVGGAGAGTTVEPPQQQVQPQQTKAPIATSSMGTIHYSKPPTAVPQSGAPPRIRATTVPALPSPLQRGAETPPPSQAASTVASTATSKRTAVYSTQQCNSGTSSQRTAETPSDAENGNTGTHSTPNAAPGYGPSQRPLSSRPNTYGLVPSQHHTDPAGLDYWFSAAAPNVPPVATAPKGVQISDIHSSMLQQTSGRDPSSPCQASNAFGRLAAATPTSSALVAACLGNTPSGTAGSNGNGVGSSSMMASAGSSGLMPNASISSGLGASAAASSSTKGGQSSSVGQRGSVTNGSRSPQEVTHTTENVLEEDEESDEDFDSEDMEDMLQRPESRGLPPPHENATLPSLTADSGAISAGGSAAAAPAAAVAAGVGGTPGAGTVPVESPGFVQVAEGIVTPTVLTADLLPGFRLRDGDQHSETASAPSPSLQARPDMVAFIPPAVLPR